VPAVVGVFHQWWLCNSGGCSGVVYSESGADLQAVIKVVQKSVECDRLLKWATHDGTILNCIFLYLCGYYQQPLVQTCTNSHYHLW
jgi:hypothetical protein